MVDFLTINRNAKSQSNDWLCLVERSIEISNLDDTSDMSRQHLILKGLNEISLLNFEF